MCSLGIALTASAAHLSPDEALARVIDGSFRRIAATGSTTGLTLSYTGPRAGVYVFDRTGGDGFIVTPADDAWPPVVAWSDTGTFTEHDAAPAMLDLLAAFDAQVAAGVGPEQAAGAAGADIAPLVSTKWDQREPYNALTPEINGQHTLTGCVATAMAQVFKTLSYPAAGTGSVSYKWSEGAQNLTYDLTGKTFDYELMDDVYSASSSAASRDAVARLMLACGMASEMNWSLTFSGAEDMDAAAALVDHFGFSRGLDLRYRDFYRLPQWETMVYGELKAGRPVLYYGFSPLGGHAFVCDGYRYEDGAAYFHFNWGWSGVSDGYFLINLLNPQYIGNGAEATGFNREQSAIFGAVPAAEAPDANPVEKMLCFGSFAPGKLSYTRNANLQFGIASAILRAGFFNMSIVPLEVTPGLKLTPADGKESPVYVAATQAYQLAPAASIPQFSVRGKEMPESGTFTASPAYRTGQGAWQDMPETLTMKSLMTITCSADGFSIVNVNNSDALTVDNLTVGSDLIVNSQPVEIEVTCRSRNLADESTVLVPVLISSEGAVSAQLTAKSVTLPDGESAIVKWDEAFPAVNPGSYSLGILNGKFFLQSDLIEVTVIDAEAETAVSISDVRINRRTASPQSTVTVSGEEISFSFKATCTEGFFDGSLTVAVIDNEGHTVKYLEEPRPVVIKPSETVNLSFRGDVLGFSPDNTYYLAVTAPSGQLSGILSERYPFIAPMAGIETISADNGSQVTEIYNLQGIRVTCPAAGSIYIVRQGARTFRKSF